jgi:hypothetical protein
MPDRVPYARVYHSIIDDPKFATIYDNDRYLATWLRLLILAEQAYPGSALLPRGTSRASVQALSDAGLIDVGEHGRYRVHGLASEREMRSQSARNAAAVRWHSEGNASTSTSTRTSTSIPPPPAERGNREEGTNPRAVGASPRQNGTSPRDLGTNPRAVRQREKRDPTVLHEILRRAAEGAS